MRWVRIATIVALVAYGFLLLRDTDEPGILHNIDLPIHETGHLVFMPFGETMHILGGSLFQILFPAIFVGYFVAVRRDRFAAAVCLVWVAQNFFDVAIYVADARAQELPLVGGGEHDWFNLLDGWNVLEKDTLYAARLRAVGVMLLLAAAWIGITNAGSTPDEGLSMADDDRVSGRG